MYKRQFQTITVEDGNNLEEIGKAIEAAKADTERDVYKRQYKHKVCIIGDF